MEQIAIQSNSIKSAEDISRFYQKLKENNGWYRTTLIHLQCNIYKDSVRFPFYIG